MNDKQVSKTVAILAKKKGFNEMCYYYYDELGCIDCFSVHNPFKPFDKNSNCDNNINNNFIVIATAPTQEFLRRWLFIKHNISILVNTGAYHTRSKKFMSIIYLPNEPTAITLKGTCRSVEAGISKALIYALKTIRQPCRKNRAQY